MRKKVLGLLSTAIIISILIVLGYKENVIKTYPSYKTSLMRGFHLIHKEGGRTKWELISEDATFPEGKKIVILKDLKMRIFYNENEITLSGGSGVYRIEDKNLFIDKPVEVNIKGSELTTDSLVWNGKEELITTKDTVKFKGKNFLIEGIGLIAKTRDQELKILEDVRGIFYY
jgi:LPS export ABC transporter protein LptC